MPLRNAAPIRLFSCAVLFAVAAGGLAAAQTENAKEPVAGEKPGGSLWTFQDLRPTITSGDGRFSLSFRGRIQVDSGFVDLGSQNRVASLLTPPKTILRRQYLGVEGRAFENFWYEYRMDFGGPTVSLTNASINIARIAYNIGNVRGDGGGPLLRIVAGVMKPMLTYEDSVSSAALTFLERADSVTIASSAFGGSTSRLGMELAFQEKDIFRAGDNFVMSAALTGGDPSSRNSAEPQDTTTEGTQLLGRIVYRISDGDKGLQVGASASHLLSVAGNRFADTRTITLQDFPEIRAGISRQVSTGPIQADGGGFWSVDSVANIRNVQFSGEYFRYHIDRDSDCPTCVAAGDPSFSGWYVQGSWMLTGEAKPYRATADNNGMAAFYLPRVAKPFSLDGQGWGAWEVAARYSDLDLNWHAGGVGTACDRRFTGCIRGGEQKIWTLGLNWYPTQNLRILVDYLIIDVDRLNGAGEQVGQRLNVLGTRLQVSI